MNDDWRIRVTLPGEVQAHDLAVALGAQNVEHGMDDGFDARVIVSLDGAELFAYAGSREQAERAQKLIDTLSVESKWDVSQELRRWHPTAEAWEDADKPLPTTEAELAAEHAERIASERAEAAAKGHGDFEVRVECRHHADTVALAEALKAEGFPLVLRWRFLLLGAADEDSAQQLAARIQAQAPAGTTAFVEATPALVEIGVRSSPFALFGGLGGGPLI